MTCLLTCLLLSTCFFCNGADLRRLACHGMAMLLAPFVYNPSLLSWHDIQQLLFSISDYFNMRATLLGLLCVGFVAAAPVAVSQVLFARFSR